MNHNDTHKYDDIIQLPHHVSKRHPQMSALNRAAQFSPFAALSGYDAAILEAARPTDDFVEPGEDRKEQIDRQLALIRENLPQQPEITVTFFRPGKNGGNYVTSHGRVKRLDMCDRQILFADGTVIPIELLYSIEGALFDDTD